MLSKDTCGFCPITTLPHGTFVIHFRNCFPPSSGLSKVAGCRQKSPPTWLVSAGYSAWHFFTNDIFKIKYPWTGHLLWQLSCPLQNFVTTLHCDQFAFGGKQSIHNLLEEFKQKYTFFLSKWLRQTKKYAWEPRNNDWFCPTPSAVLKIFDHCGNVLICLLINTSASSHWLKSVAWPVGPVLKFRDIPDWWQMPYKCPGGGGGMGVLGIDWVIAFYFVFVCLLINLFTFLGYDWGRSSLSHQNIKNNGFDVSSATCINSWFIYILTFSP